MSGRGVRLRAWRLLPLVSAVFVLLAPSSLHAQSAENVAVVINDNSPTSQQIGEYYARKRALPQANVIHIRTAVQESIDRAAYATTIEIPIAAALQQRALQDRILYLVLTKGIPLRISGDSGPQTTMASVDSEATLIYRHMVGQATAVPGRLANPYYLGDRPVSDAKPFTHREHDIYLVTRLDGYTVDDVIGLIDRGMTPSREGRIVLDEQDKLFNRSGDDWLEAAAMRLEAQGGGNRVLLDKTVQGVRNVAPVLGYYSWGSNDPRNRTRKFMMGFVPGALAGMFVSTDARTFKEPPADWQPGDNEKPETWFAGSAQSLIGDLIREGVTGVSGHVTEPYLEATVRPQILFPGYLAGYNLAEAFYMAMPFLSWQNIVIGDPLCAPFRERVLTRADVEEGLDADSRLPSLFSARRAAQLKPLLPGVPEHAIKLIMRAEGLLVTGDRAAAREVLEQVTKAAPGAAYAHLQLGVIYDADQNVAGAIEQYRRVIELQPRNATALNNLAFALATRRNATAEALPLARRALAVGGSNPAFLDTLAWIEHLMGEDSTAARRMALAVRAAPQNADLRLHAAIIYAATGARAVAETELQQALKLQPSLENATEVKQLRTRLAQLAAAVK